MFTGIVEEVGTIRSAEGRGEKARLVVEAKIVLEGTKTGDSINVEGVCQTVTEIGSDFFAVDTLAESLKKTTLGRLKAGSPVNLERALRPDSRIGGHFVQGHVSAACPIREIRRTKDNIYLVVGFPDDLLRYCVREGSIALDGISLTVSAIEGDAITANIIPVTMERTSLRAKKAGDYMNAEVDVIGRYVERLLSLGAPGKGLTADRMKELGY